MLGGYGAGRGLWGRRRRKEGRSAGGVVDTIGNAGGRLLCLSSRVNGIWDRTNCGCQCVVRIGRGWRLFVVCVREGE